MVSHLASLWNRGLGQLRNDLIADTAHVKMIIQKSGFHEAPTKPRQFKNIHHFHIDHNAPCLTLKFCIVIVIWWSMWKWWIVVFEILWVLPPAPAPPPCFSHVAIERPSENPWNQYDNWRGVWPPSLTAYWKWFGPRIISTVFSWLVVDLSR